MSFIDNIYSKKKKNIDKFVFDEKVADVFDDMIKRSVPGYELSLSMISLLASKYIQKNTNVYDLGCSLGTVSQQIYNEINSECNFVSVDSSRSMIEKCKENLRGLPIEIICSDILDVKLENASFVILNYVLQFIDVTKRLDLLKSVYDALVPGGAVVISDKLDFDLENEKDFYTELHYDFKKVNGYDELEIEQKRTALENVLVADTVETHKKRLKDVGFKDVYVVYRCLNFVSIFAKK